MTEVARDPALGSTELWQDLFERAPFAYALVAPDGTVVRGNAAHRAMFGYDGTGPPFSMVSATHPEDDPRVAAEIARIHAGELDTYEDDVRFFRADGSMFRGRFRVVPQRGASGEVVALLGAIEDVTDHDAAREELEASESRFRALVQNAADAIVLVGPDADLRYASPSADVLIGGTAGARVGLSVLDHVHEDDHAAVTTAFITAAHAPGVAVPLRFRLRHYDGSVRVVEAVATNLLDDPAVEGIVINLRDLTDQQHAVTALEASENRFRRMLENISDTVTVIDSGGRVIDTTGNVKEILGYGTEYWRGADLFTMVHPDDHELMTRKFVEITGAPGAQTTAEFRMRAADGSYIFVEGHAVNLVHDRDVRAIVITTRNITQRKLAELELAAARDEAVRSLQLRTEFVANVSHELRTPIHGVLGLAELLASSDLDPESASLVQSIRRATESLRGVLDDVLDFAKIEAGRLQLDVRPTSLTELLEDVADLFRHVTATKGIVLGIALSPDLPVRVDVDSLRLRQVLTNLVGNAVKFTAAGTVEIDVHRRAVDDASDVTVAAGELVIDVVDSGVGIREEAIERIFEPFSQAHADTARDYGGTGLGLTICRRLVELMGGTLGVTSTVGVGSTFRVVLPLRATTTPVVTPASPPAHSGTGGNGRILVVEDNPVNQLLVTRQLERLGYQPVVVGGGFEALDRFAAGDPFDLVLMDWRMPEIDGLATTERLRAIEADQSRRRVPVVGMTASVLEGDRERCLAAGMDDVVAKPVNLATLGRTLATWLAVVPTAAAGAAGIATAARTGRGAAYLASAGAGSGTTASVIGPVPSSASPPATSRVQSLDDGTATTGMATGGRATGGSVDAIDSPEAQGVPRTATASSVSTAAARSGDAGVAGHATESAAAITLAGVSGSPASPSAVGGGLPVVERQVVDRLLDELEDAAIVASVVTTYLRELGPRVEGIEDAARTGDRDQLRLLTHTLASTSAAMGAIGLGDVCRALERGVVAGVEPDEGFEPALASVRALADQVREELGAVLDDLRP